MKKRGSKSAQAQIITTVLIILVVLVTIVIIWNVINRTVSEKSKEIGIGKFSVSLSTSKVDLDVNPILIPVERSVGAGDLVSIRIIFIDDTGNSGVYENTTAIPGELETITYSINPIVDIDPTLPGNIISFEVYPIILVSGKEVIGLKASGGGVVREEEGSTECVSTVETCDGIDNDCDELVDEACSCSGDPMIFCNTYDEMKDVIGTQCDDADCSTYERWCNGADINQNGDVDGFDYGIWQVQNGGSGCDYTIWATGGGEGSDWCNGADIDQDGDVDGFDFGIWQSGGSECNLPKNIYIDCYSTFVCDGTNMGSCEVVPGCSWTY